MKQDLLDLNFEDLKSFLKKNINIEEKKLNMRAQQIFNAVYQKGLNDFNKLTTIPLELRENLKAKYRLIIQNYQNTQVF